MSEYNSIAILPNGKKAEVVIKNGKSYLKDGSRIPIGTTVKTAGGTFKLTEKGGVKVDSDPFKNTSQRTNRTTNSKVSSNKPKSSSSKTTTRQRVSTTSQTTSGGLTYDEALEIARKQAYSAGANPDNISPGYVEMIQRTYKKDNSGLGASFNDTPENRQVSKQYTQRGISEARQAQANQQQIDYQSMLDKALAEALGQQQSQFNSTLTQLQQQLQATQSQYQQQQSQYQQQQEAIQEQLEQWQQQQEELRRQAEAEEQARQEYLNWALNPDTYNQIFDQIMQQQQPLFESQKQVIGDAVQEQRRQADIDAERRGIYNSGIASTMQQQLSENETEAIARALAELQAQATGLTSDYQNKLIQKAQLEGNWANQNRQLDQQALAGYLDNYLAGQQLGLDYMNSDRDFYLGNQRLGLDYLNANRGYELDQARLGLDYLNSNRDYELGLQKLGLSQAELLERARQFDSEMGYKQQALDAELSMFANKLGYDYAKLGVDEKIALANANLRGAELALASQKFSSEQEALAAQSKREKLADTLAGMNWVKGVLEQGANPADILDSLEIYKDVYGEDVYNTLKDIVVTATQQDQDQVDAVTGAAPSIPNQDQSPWVNGALRALLQNPIVPGIPRLP